MACWHEPAPYNTDLNGRFLILGGCWRCDYARDYYRRIHFSWTLFIIAVVAFLIAWWL